MMSTRSMSEQLVEDMADLSKFGIVEGNKLTCNLHGWDWNLDTGRCLTSRGHELRTTKLEA